MLNPEDTRMIEEARKRRLYALDVLSKTKSSEMPAEYTRITKDRFRKLIDPDYHKDKIEDIVSLVYDKKEVLMNIPYIVIDGGDMEIRKAAGCAILFRMIFYQRDCRFVNCGTIVDNFQSFDTKSKNTEITKTDFIENLKSYEALFISEFRPDIVKAWSLAGGYLDDILDNRYNEKRPTIISFTLSMEKGSVIRDLVCGQHLAKISQAVNITPNPSKDFLRIRVRINKDWNK